MKTIKLRIKRNREELANFVWNAHACVGVLRGAEWMLEGFSITDNTAILRFMPCSKHVTFDGMTYQIYRQVDFKYALRRLRRMCL